MGTGFLLYLITRMDSIKLLLGNGGLLIIVISAGVFVALALNANTYADDSDKKAFQWCRKPVKIAMTIGVAMIVVNSLIPSTGELALIIGTDKLAASPEFQQIINGVIHDIMKAIGGS